MATLREGTIKYAVPNLRERWTSELIDYTDNQIAACYEDFSLSDQFGENDDKFPLWFGMIKDYPE